MSPSTPKPASMPRRLIVFIVVLSLVPAASVIDRAGFDARKVREHSLVVESLILYELLPR